MLTKLILPGVSLLAALALGCDREAASYLTGTPLDELPPFKLFSPDVGIHPSRQVIDDPHNMFVDDPLFGGLGEDPGSRWRVQKYADGYGIDHPQAWVVAFYSWATLLTREPWGEPQFYVGITLRGIYEDGYEAIWQDDRQGERIRLHGIMAFQKVLDEFSDHATYDEATGSVPSSLARRAYMQIEALGGTPQGWKREGEYTDEDWFIYDNSGHIYYE